MKYRKNSFFDLLESYFNTHLPVAKGLSAATVTSYKATFRVFIEFMYTVKEIPAEKIYFEMLDAQVITEFLDWLESERKCSIALGISVFPHCPHFRYMRRTEILAQRLYLEIIY